MELHPPLTERTGVGSVLQRDTRRGVADHCGIARRPGGARRFSDVATRVGSELNTCIMGLAWGDEGKGKITDLLCPAFDFVVRYNGGANAGHTVCVGDRRFALHLLPSGILHQHVTSVIGPGVVVDPTALLAEIDALAESGIRAAENLKISDRAHLVLPYHKIEDTLSETAADPSGRIGTTARGIGPCYADKMRRTSAVRFADVLSGDGWSDRLRRIVVGKKAMLTAMYGEDGGLDADSIVADLGRAIERLGDHVTDTTALLGDAIDAGRPILFEGANGILLDVDHGTYPFVTSSSTGAHGVAAGAGVPRTAVSHVLGVTKAYATRVGSGPFVAELVDETGDLIRERGHEYGTTTGRPRRCGWFDAVATRYGVRLAGVTDIVLAHLDTLSSFDRVGICVGYDCDGEILDTPPADAARLERAKPVLEFMPGWSEDLRGVRRFEELPATVLAYIDRVEQLVEAPVSIVGVGPERTETLLRGRWRSILETTASATANES